eukprot:COSAG02_NODE_7857_length_2815_cov_1.307806_1_plen_89_part_10
MRRKIRQDVLTNPSLYRHGESRSSNFPFLLQLSSFAWLSDSLTKRVQISMEQLKVVSVNVVCDCIDGVWSSSTLLLHRSCGQRQRKELP